MAALFFIIAVRKSIITVDIHVNLRLSLFSHYGPRKRLLLGFTGHEPVCKTNGQVITALDYFLYLFNVSCANVQFEIISKLILKSVRSLE